MKSFQGFRNPIFHYDLSETAGCSESASNRHKRLPLTTATFTQVPLPSAAFALQLLQFGSVLVFGTSVGLNVTEVMLNYLYLLSE